MKVYYFENEEVARFVKGHYRLDDTKHQYIFPKKPTYMFQYSQRWSEWRIFRDFNVGPEGYQLLEIKPTEFIRNKESLFDFLDNGLIDAKV
jgi:hypothetical protein